MPKIITRETLTKKRPVWQFADGFDLSRVAKRANQDQKDMGILAEFIGTGDLASQWVERQAYEVAAGRDEEPLLYESFYDVQVNSMFPRVQTIYRLGPAGVVLEAIVEGGEVKFMTLTDSNITLTQLHYGVGLQYSKDLEIFNELWAVNQIERRVGTAYNALLNHIHINPILAASYAAANQTAADSTGATLQEKFIRTLENAVQNSEQDASNPRRGPYDLLIAGGNRFMVERILNPVPQQGISLQSSVLGMIQNVIVYDGWAGARGAKTTTYTGVSTGTAYLINKRYKEEDFLSRFKQTLESEMGNPDVSRFIRAQTVWDTYFGVYANPTAAVEEITWPTS